MAMQFLQSRVLWSLALHIRLAWCAIPCRSDGKLRSRACIIHELRGAERLLSRPGAQAVYAAEHLYAEPMPAAVNTIFLGEEAEKFDSENSWRMLEAMRQNDAYQYFSHARDTFSHHLQGTWGILNSWGQSTEICRAGLFHTVYGADLFIFSTLDPYAASSRKELRSLVGDEAEALTWDFGSLAQSAVNASLYASPSSQPPSLPAEGMTLDSYVDGQPRHVSARQLAKMSIVRIADNLDQMVEANLWRDVHSHAVPSVLYPGAMKPAVTLYWMSRLCKAVRDFLDVVPPIFDDCKSEIAYEAEVEARDLYWTATAEGQDLSSTEKVELLERAASLNPFVAEPQVYLSELHFQDGRFEEGALAARQALKLFYGMSTQWDKRLPFRQWVNTARMFLLRCVRSAEGKSSLPVAASGVVLTGEVIQELARVSPLATSTATSTVAAVAPATATIAPADLSGASNSTGGAARADGAKLIHAGVVCMQCKQPLGKMRANAM